MKENVSGCFFFLNTVYSCSHLSSSQSQVLSARFDFISLGSLTVLWLLCVC